MNNWRLWSLAHKRLQGWLRKLAIGLGHRHGWNGRLYCWLQKRIGGSILKEWVIVGLRLWGTYRRQGLDLSAIKELLLLINS